MNSKNFNLTTLNPIPFRLFDGIYLVKRKAIVTPLIDHYGIIVKGQALKKMGYSPNSPLVFHLTDQGILAEWLEYSGDWEPLGQVSYDQTNQAVSRLLNAFNNSTYDLFANNCEQFARYVTEGVKQSHQLQNAGLLTIGVIGVGAMLWASSKD